MKETAIQCADPKTRIVTGECRYPLRFERRVELSQMAAVPHQYSGFLGTNKDASAWRGNQGRQFCMLRPLRPDMAKRLPVKRHQPFSGSGDPKLGCRRIAR